MKPDNQKLEVAKQAIEQLTLRFERVKIARQELSLAIQQLLGSGRLSPFGTGFPPLYPSKPRKQKAKRTGK